MVKSTHLYSLADNFLIWQVSTPCRPLGSTGPEYDFMNYSAVNWLVHFQIARLDENDLLLQSAFTLYDTDSKRLQLWFERYWES